MAINTEISREVIQAKPSGENRGSLPPKVRLLAVGAVLVGGAPTLTACGEGPVVEAQPEETPTPTSDSDSQENATPTPESTATAVATEAKPSPTAATELPPTPTITSTPELTSELQTNLKMAQARVNGLNEQLASFGSPLSIIINTDQAVGKYQLLMVAKTADDTTKTVSLGFLNLENLSLTLPTTGRAVSLMDLRATAEGLIAEPAETDDSSTTQGKGWTFDSLSMRWEEKAINELTPCELGELINLEDYFSIADSTDPETGLRLTLLWNYSEEFLTGTTRFHQQGLLSEIHTPTGEVVPGGLARAFLDSYFSVVIEKYHGLITVLDAGGVLTEEPRMEPRTGKEIVDVNHFRGHFVQINVSQVSQVVVAPARLIETGRYAELLKDQGRQVDPVRDQRREVELPDGRTLVLDVNYNLPQNPTFGGLFALPDPDNPAKYILVLITNTSDFANARLYPNIDVPYAFSETMKFNVVLSWAVQSPAKLEASQGLESILTTREKFEHILPETDERFFIFDDMLPLLHPIRNKNN